MNKDAAFDFLSEIRPSSPPLKVESMDKFKIPVVDDSEAVPDSRQYDERDYQCEYNQFSIQFTKLVVVLAPVL